MKGLSYVAGLRSSDFILKAVAALERGSDLIRFAFLKDSSAGNVRERD